jgi:hypothetical protein
MMYLPKYLVIYVHHNGEQRNKTVTYLDIALQNAYKDARRNTYFINGMSP